MFQNLKRSLANDLLMNVYASSDFSDITDLVAVQLFIRLKAVRTRKVFKFYTLKVEFRDETLCWLFQMKGS